MDLSVHVLIIEDSEDDALLLLRELRRGGYAPVHMRVDTSADLEQALDTHAWDIIIADYAMPRFSAPAALQLVQQRGLNVPFIIVSGAIGEETAVAAMKAGAHDYLLKHNLARLVPAVDRELREVQSRVARKHAEQALQESEARFRQIFEAAPMGVAVVNLEDRLLKVNTTFKKMLGYTEEELIGCPLAAITHPEDVDVDAILTRGASRSSQAEKRLLRKNQELLWAKVTTTVMRSEQGALVHGLHVVEDITDRKRVDVVLEAERRRVAYDLHDGLAQIAAAVHQHLQVFAYYQQPRNAQAQQELDDALMLAQRLVRETRRMIAGLRPTMLDDLGLAAALHHQVEALQSEGWRITMDDNMGTDRLAPAVETALFWVAQEALTNIRKHAGSTRADIRLHRTETHVRLAIQDYGCGFQLAETPKQARYGEQVGLLGMQERIALVGGHCTIESQSGVGTWIIATMPLQPFVDEEP